MSFEDFKVDELRKIALEEFAVEVSATDNKEVVLAAIAEAGYKWRDYLKLHPELAPPEPEPNRVPEPTREGSVITTSGMHREEPVAQTPVVVRAKEEFVPVQEEKYLVKMTRPNILFENHGYRFTKEHPYALVDGRDLKKVVEDEDGFRQATPTEVEEFYG